MAKRKYRTLKSLVNTNAERSKMAAQKKKVDKEKDRRKKKLSAFKKKQRNLVARRKDSLKKIAAMERKHNQAVETELKRLSKTGEIAAVPVSHTNALEALKFGATDEAKTKKVKKTKKKSTTKKSTAPPAESTSVQS